MKVSITVPAYNAASTIADTFRSVLVQRFQLWEAIVVDDDSTGATAELAKEVSGDDRRIRIVQQQNGGESAARNRGIDEVRFDWLLFLDADDWIAPSHLERLTAEAKSLRGLDAVHCRSLRVAADGVEVADEYFPPAGDLFPTLAHRAAFPVHAWFESDSNPNLLSNSYWFQSQTVVVSTRPEVFVSRRRA